MTDKITEVAKEGNPINKGILISAIVIFSSLIPNVEIGIVKIIPMDSWLLLLAGFTSLFYFISIKVNQSDYVDDKGISWTRTLVFKSSLSKEIQGISIFTLVLFVLRGGYLFIKMFI